MRPFSEARAVVTGANRADGIGLALVRELTRRGVPSVAGTYRDAATALPLLQLAEADRAVLAAPLDVTDDQSAAAFAAWCREALGRVDLLVNNAGLGDVGSDVLRSPLDELRLQLETHAIGMLRLTRALLPALGHGTVVLNISSTLGSLAHMSSSWAFYSAAKVLQNALTRELADALRAEGVVVCAVSPGWVQTSMGGRGATLSPEESARALVRLAETATMADSGSFREHDGRSLPW